MAETNLGLPKPTRFEKDIEDGIEKLDERFGLGFSEIVRRSTRYCVPKFLTGEIDVHRITSRKASVELLNAARPSGEGDESAPVCTESGPVAQEVDA